MIPVRIIELKQDKLKCILAIKKHFDLTTIDAKELFYKLSGEDYFEIDYFEGTYNCDFICKLEELKEYFSIDFDNVAYRHEFDSTTYPIAELGFCGAYVISDEDWKQMVVEERCKKLKRIFYGKILKIDKNSKIRFLPPININVQKHYYRIETPEQKRERIRKERRNKLKRIFNGED